MSRRRKKAFKVEHLPGASDKEGEQHFVITGTAVTSRFSRNAMLATTIEAFLNAAYLAAQTGTLNEDGQ